VQGLLPKKLFAASLAALALAVACASSGPPARTPSGARASCSAAADCVVTNFGGCCACCKDAVHAVPASDFAHRQHQCSVVDCSACADGIVCPKVEDAAGFVAKCQDGTCAAVRK
jgi:hypothetical protein